MALRKMTMIAADNENSGGWFNVYIATEGVSDVYQLPIQPMYAIGTTISGNGYLDFSVSSITELEADRGIFQVWDGVAQINPAVTGFRVVSTSGLVTANVTVKTTHAS